MCRLTLRIHLCTLKLHNIQHIMTTKFIGVREFRQNISDLYRTAQKKKLRYIVLNKNKPVFEVRPLSVKDSSLEYLLEAVQEARGDLKAGRVHSLESMEQELGII